MPEEETTIRIVIEGPDMKAEYGGTLHEISLSKEIEEVASDSREGMYRHFDDTGQRTIRATFHSDE